MSYKHEIFILHTVKFERLWLEIWPESTCVCVRVLCIYL